MRNIIVSLLALLVAVPVYPAEVVVSDSFASNSYTGMSDDYHWTTDWIEFGDNNNSSNGYVYLWAANGCHSIPCVRIQDAFTTAMGVKRTIDLSHATQATLNLNYTLYGGTTGAKVYAESAGQTVLLTTLTSTTAGKFESISVDLDAAVTLSSSVVIKIQTNTQTHVRTYLDDISIQYTTSDYIVPGLKREPLLREEFTSGDAGWVKNPLGNDTDSNNFKLGNGAQVQYQGVIYQRSNTQEERSALYTDGLNSTSSPSNYDLDGTSTIDSPSFTVPSDTDLVEVSFEYYFAHTSTNTADYFRVYLVDGSTEHKIFEQTGTNSAKAAEWSDITASKSGMAGKTLKVRIRVADLSSNTYIVEGALDNIQVTAVSTNRGPVVEKFNDITMVITGYSSIPVIASDSPNQALSYSIQGFPAASSINATTGVMWAAAGFASSVPHFGVIAVSDGSEATEASSLFKVIRPDQPFSSQDTVYSEDFEGAHNWTTDPDGIDTAFKWGLSNQSGGEWAVGDPQATTYNGKTYQLSNTVSGTKALVTDPGSATSASRDVDHGFTTAQSPKISLPASGTTTLSFEYTVGHSFAMGTGDGFKLQVLANNHIETLWEYSQAANDEQAVWTTQTVSLDAYAGHVVQLRFVASDLHFSSDSLFEVAVDDVVITNVDQNSAPTLQTIPNQNSTEGNVISLQVVGSDPDGDGLYYSSTTLPPGLTISAIAGHISGTLTAGSVGTHQVTIDASDGLETVSTSFTWVVGGNSQPVVTWPNPSATYVGEIVSLQVSATDPDGDTLTYSATGLPTGLSINSGSGLITGTVTALDPSGEFNPQITVSDSVTLPVVNTIKWPAPAYYSIVTPATQTNNAGDAVSLDIPYDPAYFRATNASGLPPNLVFNAVDYRIEGTLSAGSSGDYTVFLTAPYVDRSGNPGQTPPWNPIISNSFTWHVVPHQPPVITPPGPQVSLVSDTVNLQIVATDPNMADTLTYEAIGLPPSLTINSSTGVISGVVATGTVNEYTVTVKATDSSTSALYDEETFVWSIDPKTLADVPFPQAADSLKQCLVDSYELGLATLISDIEQVKCASKGVVDISGIKYLKEAWEIDFGEDYVFGNQNPNAIANITELSQMPKLEVVTLTSNQVSSLVGLSSSSIRRLHLNDNPVVNLTGISGLTSIEILNLSDTSITDISLLSGLSTLQELWLQGTAVSSLSPLSGLSSLTGLTIKTTQVTDLSPLSGLTNLESLVASNNAITSVSALSALTNLKVVFVESTQVSDLGPLANHVNLEILDAENTSVSSLSNLTNLPLLESLDISSTQVTDLTPIGAFTAMKWLSLNNNSGVVNFAPLSALTGLLTLEISGTDLTSLSQINGLSSLHVLHASNVNLSSLQDLVELENFNNLRDLHLDTSQLVNIQPIIDHTSLYPNLLGYVDLEGNTSVTCAQLDRLEVALNIYNKTLLRPEAPNCAVNNSPQVTTISNQTSNEGDSVSLQVFASDDNGDKLNYRLSPGHNDLSINYYTGLITGTWSQVSGGSYPIIVIVNDGSVDVPVSFTWTVNAIDPVINSFTVSSTNINEGQDVTLSWNVSNAMSCLATGGAPGWSGAQSVPSGSLQLTIENDGLYTFGLSCTDGFTNTSATTPQVTVNNIDVSIDSFSATSTNINVGQTSTISWSVTNADTCTPLGNFSPWTSKTINPPSGSETLTFNTLGSYTLTLKCDNSHGRTDQKSVTISVTNPVAPSNTATPNAPTAYSPPSVSSASSQVGATAGQFRVDESGSATYSIPVLTAPGSGGVAPEVSFNYNSTSANGTMGVGWSLGGISAITRCAQTLEQDRTPTKRGVTITSEDRFCLDGQRLVLVSGTYGANGAKYRTEIDGFSEVISHGSAGNGPEWFEVRRKDGSVSEYGGTIDSSIEARLATDSATVFTWAQNRFQDSAGNYILYTYSENSGNNPVDFVLNKVAYTGNVNAPTVPYAELQFVYEDRLEQGATTRDTAKAYVAGAEFYQTKLLKRVDSVAKVKASDASFTSIRSYFLSYGEDGFGRKVLESIEECNNSSKSYCFAPTDFTWTKSEQTVASTAGVTFNGLPSELGGLQLGDVNGDGRQDIIFLEESGSNFNLKIAHANENGGFTVASSSYFIEAKQPVGSSPVPVPVYTMDVNADGYQDMIYIKGPNGSANWYTRLSDGFDFETTERLLGASGLMDPPVVRVMDFNGDGLSDLLFSNNQENLVVLFNEYDPAAGVGFSSTGQVIQVDTSGLFPASSGSWYIEEERRVFNATAGVLNSRVADYNGDGAVDLLVNVSQSYCADPCGGNNIAEIVAEYDAKDHSITTQFNFDEAVSPIPDPGGNRANLSLWIVYESNGVDGFGSPKVIAKGVDCLVGPACSGTGTQQYGAYPTAGAIQPQDINGDGLADIAYRSANAGIWTFRINTGRQFLPEIQLPSINTDVIAFSRFQDINGDGLVDMIYPSQKENASATWWAMYNSQGESFSAAMNTGIKAGYQDPTPLERKDASIFVDFTGDGKTDQLYIVYNSNNTVNNVNLYKGKNLITGSTVNEAANVITKITNGFGAETDITYKPLTDDLVYTRMNNSSDADWGQRSPVYDVIAPMYVVSKVASSSPLHGSSSSPNAKSAVEYHYVGARVQSGGRGFLGFAEVISYDPQSVIRTNTRYRQDFPYVGLPADTTQAITSVSRKFDPVSNTAGQSVTTWSAVTSSTPAASIHSSDKLTSYAINQWASSTTVAGKDAVFPYIAKALERSYTISGVIDRRVLTTNTYGDNYGNLTKVVINTYDQNSSSAFATQTTDNTYADDISDWHLGRLVTSTVKHERSGLPDITRESRFEYHPTTGLLDKEIVEPNDNAFKVETVYDLDAFGNRVKTTVMGYQVDAREVWMDYDSLGRYVEETRNHYGQVTSRVDNWDVFGNPLDLTDISGVRTRNVRDHMGRDFYTHSTTGSWSKVLNVAGAGTVCPSGGSPDYQVTAFHTVATVGGAPTQYKCYDKVGREIRTATQGFEVTPSPTDALINVDTYYDNLGRTKGVSEPYYSGGTRYWNTTTYDVLGRPLSTNSADGNHMSFSYDGTLLTNSCSGVSGVRVTQQRNQLGQDHYEIRNPLGELESVIDDNCNDITYGYDAIGNTTSVTGVDDEVVTMVYDKAGRKTSMDDPDKGVWEYAYNALGEMTRQRDSKNQAIDFYYDRLGRVWKREELYNVASIGDTSVSLSATELTVYNNGLSGNGKGSLDKVTYTKGSDLHERNYIYDSLGRVSIVSTTIDAEQFAEETVYDEFGRIFQQFDASGDDRGIHYIYNARGYLSQLKEARDQVGGTVYQSIETMDARGNVTHMELGNETDVYAVYEANSGRLDRLYANKANGSKVQYVDYLFDVLGNLKQRVDTSELLPADYRTEDFGYDSLNRLETVDLTQGSSSAVRTLTVTYNDVGNITSKSDVGSYLYNASQPHAVSGIAGGTTYTYDNNGNQESGDGRTITYTIFDKPDSIDKGSSTTLFDYGIGNSRYRRIDQTNSITDKTTLYIGNVERITDSTTTFKRYIGGVAISTFHTSTLVSSDQYLIKDHIGSIHTVLDDNENIVTRMHFSAFGERQDSTWNGLLTSAQIASLNAITTRGFTGHEQVDDAGIIHMNGRIYDPKLGRFLQADPVVQAPKNGQNLNRYTYVLNNPLSYTDPSGYFFKRFFKKWLRPLAAIAVSVLTYGTATGWLAGTFLAGNGIAIGAVAGGISGFVGGAIATGTLRGAFIGAVTGAAFGAIGASGLKDFTRGLAHGVTGGVGAELQGGKFGHGFLTAGLSKAFSLKAEGFLDKIDDVFLESIIVGTAAGTISRLVGGKFANAAVTGAFAYQFNQVSGRITAKIGEWFKNKASEIATSISDGAEKQIEFHGKMWRMIKSDCSKGVANCIVELTGGPPVDSVWEDTKRNYLSTSAIYNIDKTIAMVALSSQVGQSTGYTTTIFSYLGLNRTALHLFPELVGAQLAHATAGSLVRTGTLGVAYEGGSFFGGWYRAKLNRAWWDVLNGE